MNAIAVVREGSGPEVLLVHGGAGPRTTWAGLAPLAKRWTLVLAYRRGFAPSPPGRHDFDVDADDIEALLGSRPHVAAHSYGVLGTLIAASRHPELVRSLTLIEPPLYHLTADDPEVAHLKQLGDTVLRDGLDSDPTILREFLRLAGAPDIDDGPLPDAVARGVRRAHGGRPPGQAAPRLDRLREARVPALVVSGGHAPGLERICDALAAELRAERAVTAGAGHFAAAAPGFAPRFERFLSAAG
jgi:pimeloyl-ACP methyl ester carboxylesterase